MRHLVCYLTFSALWGALYSALPSPAQSAPPQAESSGSSVRQAPAKRERSDEKKSSAQGTVGTLPASNRPLPSPASISNGASFVNPKEGQIVHPGETIHIDLVVDAGLIPLKGVGIVSPMGFSNEVREGPPYSFAFRVPDKDLTGSSHRLIGFQSLTLFGTVVGRTDYDLAATIVDVEESDLPLSLFASGRSSQYGPLNLNFYALGGDDEIDIYAKFPNGHELDVTESTYIALSSENQAVAIIGEDGTVASVGPGRTRIIATYSLGTQQKRLYVPVTVDATAREIDASPATFHFGDVPSNTVSPPLQITITNHTEADVHLDKLQPRGFPVISENCSNTTLPPHGSCIITVTFIPTRPGYVHGNIFVLNSRNGIFGISLFGNGT